MSWQVWRIAFARVGLAVLVVGGVAWRASSAAAPTPQPLLASIKGDLLATYGVSVTRPDAGEAAAATMTQDAAKSAASAHLAPSSTFREAALADYTERTIEPAFHCLCWVVVTEPAGGIFIGGPPAAAGRTTIHLTEPFHYDLFDARTGAWLGAREGARAD